MEGMGKKGGRMEEGIRENSMEREGRMDEDEGKREE